MMDLSLMTGIRVDPARRTAHARAGLRPGEFDRETQSFGLAMTLGVNRALAPRLVSGRLEWAHSWFQRGSNAPEHITTLAKDVQGCCSVS
jgi:hypothetical protein